MDQYKSAEVVSDSSGRQYHINLNEKEIARRIILVGDPERATLASSFFDKVLLKREKREFVSYTGIYKGLDITVMSIGIGAPAMEIAVIELAQLVYPLTIIRCGSCGALQSDIDIGDMVITSAALRIENSSTYFVEDFYPAVSDYEVVSSLLKAAEELDVKFHYGLTATSPGFYGAQCRHIKGFPLRDETLVDRLSKQGVKNLEMEISTLLTLASLRGFRAGAVCAVFASRTKNIFISPDKKKDVEKKALLVALEAFCILEKIDKQKGNNKIWVPKI